MRIRTSFSLLGGIGVLLGSGVSWAAVEVQKLSTSSVFLASAKNAKADDSIPADAKGQAKGA